MLSAILVLVALPWLDTSKIRSAVFKIFFTILVQTFFW
jgi:quinol-cytochrome oxidoreductase complex cytochrome b subunit